MGLSYAEAGLDSSSGSLPAQDILRFCHQRGLGDGGLAQTPSWFIPQQHQQSAPTGGGCSHTAALVLVPPALGKEAWLSGPKGKHNHPNQEPTDHLRTERAEGEPSLQFPRLGREGGKCWGTLPALCPLSLPARRAAAAHSAPSSLPSQSLNPADYHVNASNV